MNRKQREIKRKRENQRRMMAKTVEHKEVQLKRIIMQLRQELIDSAKWMER